MSAFDPTSYNNSQAPQGNSGGGGAPGGFEGFFIEELQPYTGPARVKAVRPVRSKKGPAISIDLEYANGKEVSAFCCMARRGEHHEWSDAALRMGSARLQNVYTACGYSFANGVPINSQGRPDFEGIVGARLNVELKVKGDKLDIASITAG